MHVMCEDICTPCCGRCVHLGRTVQGVHMNASSNAYLSATRPFIEQAILDNLSVFDKALPIQMKHLITQPLIKASLQAGRSSPWPSLIIIDGLDECNGEKVQADILHMLNVTLLQLKSSLPTLYLLIASRPEPAICDVFRDKLSVMTHHLLLDSSYNPDRDIPTFLRSSFADIYHRRHTRFRSMSSPCHGPRMA